MLSKEKIARYTHAAPLLHEVMALKPVTWLNPHKKAMSNTGHLPFGIEDIREADELWKRFMPFFKKAFPETVVANGVIESPLWPIPKLQEALQRDGEKIEGRMFLKCDNALPIVGSVKARGGFYEILRYAEKLALEAGIVQKTDDYSVFSSASFKTFFEQFRIGVGSTGNLGLSIGTLSAELGFQVTVYMSADAKTWKKELLRQRGATVVEFDGDFSEAILTGREETQRNPKAYFVDDENSTNLFLGYSTSALRLAEQLKAQGIKVDETHPLLVYSPCGVGGSSGGIAFGLKQVFGDNVHCFFVEPTHSPSVLTGMATGEMSEISVQDIGLDNRTEADGLAVGRPSRFATEISNQLISGIYTLEDDELFKLLVQLKDTEDIFVEPSATAGLIGPQRIAQTPYAQTHKLNMAQATHVVWATGGDLVPKHEREIFYKRGKTLLSPH